MSQQQPPRPNGPHRVGSGKRVEIPERSISPAPVAIRNPPIIPDQTAVIDAEWADDPLAVRSADEREELLRAQRAENARLKVELERKSRVPDLPSPRTDRQRATEWPPQSVPAPGYRPRQESNVNLHVVLEREARERAESLVPKSGRQRAGEALRTPVAKVAGALLAAFLGGGGASVAVDASKKPPAPEKPAASQELGATLTQNQRQFGADLGKNYRADRDREAWAEAENDKAHRRLKRIEQRLKLQPDESLEPDEPPPTPPPPRKPDLPERL